MKALIHFWLFVALALLPAQGQGILSLAGSPPAAGGGAWGSPTTTLYSTDAEGTGTPAGWTDTGAPNWDATDQFKIGAQSFKVEPGKYSKAPNIDGSEIWLNFWFRAATFPASAQGIFKGFNSGFGATLGVTLSATGELALLDAGVAPATTSAISTDTWVYVSVYYLKGTGANSVGKIAWSTDGSSPSSGAQYATYTNGIAATNIVHTYWSGETVSWYDDISAKAP